MSKINFRFTLLKARFPDLYQEAQNKIAGSVAPKDVMADWLNELVYRRGMSSTQQVSTETETADDTNDIDFAKSIMDGLSD